MFVVTSHTTTVSGRIAAGTTIILKSGFRKYFSHTHAYIYMCTWKAPDIVVVHSTTWLTSVYVLLLLVYFGYRRIAKKV